MTDSDALEVPRSNSGDELRAAGFNASLSLIPIAGSIASEFITAGLSIKARARDEEFFEEVAHRIQRLEGVAANMTADQFFDDDFLNANAHTIVRAARETADRAQRRLLAGALVNAGSWSTHGDVLTRRFVEIVIRYTPLHVKVLVFYRNPLEWLEKYSPTWGGASYMMGGIGAILRDHVFPNELHIMPEVERVIGELARDGLLDSPGLNTVMTARGMVEPRILPLGSQFLDFLSATDEVESA